MRSTLLALALVACGPMNKQTNDPNAKTEVVCHDVADTGTNISHRECVTHERQGDEHSDSMNMMGENKPKAQPTKHQ